MGLISMVYISSAARKMDDEELRALLEQCRANNARLDVTGMLLYRDGFFIQALEGEEAVVRSLYEKIRTDPRHKSVLPLLQTPVEQRSFESWSMGFRKFEDHDLEAMEGYTDYR